MVKTTELTGTEVKVEGLGGQNVAVKNLGSGSIYVSTQPNITAGANNVIEIPAGAGEVVLDARGTVYIVGTGKVQCTGTPYAVPNFKLPSTSSGGGGGTSDVTKEYVDAQDTTNLNLAKSYTDNAKSEIQTTIDTVNDTLNTHIADQVKHITAEEREKWNAKAETDTATTTADGLMSAADKEKLDGIAANANKYSLPLATASVRGGAKIGYEENGKNYPVELDSEKMFVNVPWENTTYSEATTSAAGLMSAADKSSLNTHIADQVKHITAEERAAWNAKADLSDIPTELPANGGNADTVDGLHANEIASNPNLLINPDFRINQRGLTEYTGTALGYTADRWWKGFQYLPTSGNVVVTTSESGSITITNSADKLVTFAQKVENSRFLYGKTVTASARIDGVTYMATGTVLTTGKGTILRGASSSKFDFTVYQDCSTERFDFEFHIASGVTVTIDWAKLEIGSIATPFCPPDPATELAKCQRYFYRLGGLKNNFVLQGLAYSPTIMSFTYQFPVEMRTLPTLSVSKGNWGFRIQKIPYEGSRYWNNEYGFVFSVDANFSYSQCVSINVNFDDTKSTIITAGDPVTIETNPDSDSSGNQKHPGWLDFDAEL